MHNSRTYLLVFGLTIGLIGLSNTVKAEIQTDNPFHASKHKTDFVTVAYQGKPPFRNRPQLVSQRKSQETVTSKLKSVNKTELSAMEIDANSTQPSTQKKNTRRKYGHPSHR